MSAETVVLNPQQSVRAAALAIAKSTLIGTAIFGADNKRAAAEIIDIAEYIIKGVAEEPWPDVDHVDPDEPIPFDLVLHGTSATVAARILDSAGYFAKFPMGHKQ